jgi:hypothetical protein
MPRSPTSSIRIVGSDQSVPSQVLTEIVEMPSGDRPRQGDRYANHWFEKRLISG